MCHPTSGDLLLRRSYRVFSGFCLRRRMRVSGHVLDLHGRVPGGRAGQHASGSSRTASVGSGTGQVTYKEQFFRRVGASKKHSRSRRVQLSTLAYAEQPKIHCRRFANLATEFPSRRMAGPGQSRIGSAQVTKVCSEATQIPTSSRTYKLSQIATPRVAICVRAVADATCVRGNGSLSTPSFRRQLQGNAGAGQIATGANHTGTSTEIVRTSVIVRVTTLGNVLASLQLIPRG